MIIHDVEQNSDEWYNVRLGIVTASSMNKIITSTGKKSTQRKKYMYQLLDERIYKEYNPTFSGNKYTDRGHEYEEEAAGYFSLLNDVELHKIGFCTTDDGLIGASLDRFINDKEIVEIKNPAIETHHEYLDSKDTFYTKYKVQVQTQMFVYGADVCHLYSYFPRRPELIIPVERDDKFISLMKKMVDEFNDELATKVEEFKEEYNVK